MYIYIYYCIIVNMIISIEYPDNLPVPPPFPAPLISKVFGAPPW